MHAIDYLPVGTPSRLTETETSDLVTRFARHGFVLIRPVEAHRWREDLLGLAGVFGRVVDHPLADAGGVVAIEPGAAPVGFAVTFSRWEMEPHTDGTFSPTPPAVIATQCEVASSEGGAACLVDGAALHRHLCHHWPNEVAALFEPDAMSVLRRDERAAHPIFSRCRDHIEVCYRFDESVAVTFSPAITPLLSAIRSFVRDPGNQVRHNLVPGEILVIDNRRVLHGRTAVGESSMRRMNRVWFDGNSAHDLRFGFEPRGAAAGAVEPVGSP